MLRFDPHTELDEPTRGLLTADRRTGSARSPRFLPVDFRQSDDNGVHIATIPAAARAQPHPVLVEHGADETPGRQRAEAPPELTQKHSSTL